MFHRIKRIVPSSLKTYLAPLYQKTVGDRYKIWLVRHMHKRHQRLLKLLNGKQRIRVVFLVIHKSMWKVDPVFQKMLTDPFFEPIVLICPFIVHGEEQMWIDMLEGLEYFNGKGYPICSAYNNNKKCWVKLKEMAPDIVFFTNPNRLTFKEYYENAYLNYLSCYAGYGISVVDYNNGQSQYNQDFHNACWKIFVQNKNMYDQFLRYSYRDTEGLHIVLDAIIEDLLASKADCKSAWKNFNTHKKVIFAPHHTINKDSSLQLGNFLEFAELMKQLVMDTRKDITWSFKPHPILKSKLYAHKEWGADRTDAYYGFWASQPNSQLDEGGYIDLFVQSDALIHDSAAFIAEYIFTDKPMLYLMNSRTRKNLNDFGNQCLNTASEAWNGKDIRAFISDLMANSDGMLESRRKFIAWYLNGLEVNKSSSAIVDIIKSSVRELNK
ncbi:hypothetical protein [Sterolibacterium denitrificans]|uniref:hypothetical protein n=1 Tax=Sterolibacterium denitrificans TaxID=157592 RepID=UPI001561ECA1|nr:hypothetical protein [Sterolibacterium denitrificans]